MAVGGAGVLGAGGTASLPVALAGPLDAPPAPRAISGTQPLRAPAAAPPFPASALASYGVAVAAVGAVGGACEEGAVQARARLVAHARPRLRTHAFAAASVGTRQLSAGWS